MTPIIKKSARLKGLLDTKANRNTASAAVESSRSAVTAKSRRGDRLSWDNCGFIDDLIIAVSLKSFWWI